MPIFDHHHFIQKDSAYSRKKGEIAKVEDEAKAGKHEGQQDSQIALRSGVKNWREDILFPILLEVLKILAPVAFVAGIVLIAYLAVVI